MKLEETIQQKQFKCPRERALIGLIFTGHYIQNLNEKFLRPFSITGQQYNVLRILRGQHGQEICLHDIKRRMLEPSPDVSRIVDRLVLAGLVRRVQDPSNRRKLNLGITDAGLELLSQIDRQRNSIIDPLAGCSDLEVSQFNAILDKVLDRLPDRTTLFGQAQAECPPSIT